jgi:hypothetical protein
MKILPELLTILLFLTPTAHAAHPLESWTIIGEGFQAAVDEATLISEYPGSKGVMLVSPDRQAAAVTARFEIMPLTPESVFVVMLAASNEGLDEGLTFPPDYDGDIVYLLERVDAYFFAFHNGAHQRTPFVRKHPFIRGESMDLDAAESNIMTTTWHRVEITSDGEGRLGMRIDGTAVLSARDQDPLVGGRIILRLRGTKTHAATALVRNLEILAD